MERLQRSYFLGLETKLRTMNRLNPHLSRELILRRPKNIAYEQAAASTANNMNFTNGKKLRTLSQTKIGRNDFQPHIENEFIAEPYHCIN